MLAKQPHLVRRELMGAELLERAATLFETKGFNGTTLQDVADTVGLTRATLYHYFESKEALLAALVEDIPVARASDVRALRTNPALSSIDKLRNVTRMMVVNVTSRAARFRLLLQNEHALPPKVAAAYARGRVGTLKELVALFEDGIRSGEFRNTDPHLAAFALLGMCNWSAWWFNPAHQTTDTVAEQFIDYALAAFASRSSHFESSRAALSRSIERLRGELAMLEQIAKGDANA